MAVQTTYTENMRPAVAGQIADTTHANLVSRNVEPAAGLGFGVPVCRGDDHDDNVKAPEAGETEILGFTVRERSLDANAPDKFPQYSSARIMLSGALWVNAAAAVDAGDAVQITLATGAIGKATGAGIIAAAGWVFDSSTSGAGLVRIRRV